MPLTSDGLRSIPGQPIASGTSVIAALDQDTLVITRGPEATDGRSSQSYAGRASKSCGVGPPMSNAVQALCSISGQMIVRMPRIAMM